MKKYLRDFYVFGLMVAFLTFCAVLAVKCVAMPAEASDIVVETAECTDLGCQQIEKAISPTGDLGRILPRHIKGIADFKTMQVVRVPAKFLRFDSKDPKSFFNPYQADPVLVFKSGKPASYTAVTLGGTVIYGANRNRPNPAELHSIVRVIGDELTVFQVMH